MSDEPEYRCTDTTPSRVPCGHLLREHYFNLDCKLCACFGYQGPMPPPRAPVGLRISEELFNAMLKL